MIKDEELLHGAALVRLIESADATKTAIDFDKDLHLSLYRVSRAGHRVGVLLKISTARKSPWGFTFTPSELEAVERYRERYPRDPFYFVLVCNRDGICCAPLDVVEALLDEGETLEWKRVGVRRPRGGSYWLSGPGRVQHERSIPMSNWPTILFPEGEE